MNVISEKLTNDILPIIVIYKLSIRDSLAWQSLNTDYSYFSSVLIYDNSPVSQPIPDTRFKVYYLHDHHNSGVSKAYNEGLKMADSLGKKWLLLLDQDTQLPNDIIASYAQSIYQYPEENFFAPILNDKIGIVSPFSYSYGITHRLNAVKKGVLSLSKYRAVNSCSLIRTQAMKLAGGFDERLPLDHSDIYFQEKLALNRSSFVVVNACIKHRFSGTEVSNKNDTLIRFEIFCKSCITMSMLTQFESNFRKISLKRALNLSLRFFTIRFIVLHLQLWNKR